MKFLDYINGSRNGKEANQIEKEALSDPFLADAIEGYHSFLDEDHTSRLEQIQAHVEQRRIRSRKVRIGYIAVAAIVFLLIGGGYFATKNQELFIRNFESNQLAMATEVQTETDETTAVSPEAEDDQEALPSESLDRALVVTPNENLEPIESSPLESDKNEDVLEREVVVEVPKTNTIEPVVDSNKKKGVDKQSIQKKSDQKIAQASVKVVDDEPQKKIPNVQTDASISNNKDISVKTLQDSVNKPIVKEKNSISQKKEDLKPSSAIVDNKDPKVEISGAKVDQKTASPISPSEMITPIPRPVIGFSKYRLYLRNNLQHQGTEVCTLKEGSVVLEFSVSETGRPINIKVIKKLCPVLDKEAIRLVSEGPDWTHSVNKGNIKVEF